MGSCRDSYCSTSVVRMSRQAPAGVPARASMSPSISSSAARWSAGVLMGRICTAASLASPPLHGVASAGPARDAGRASPLATPDLAGRSFGRHATHERISLGMVDGVHRQVDVEVGPVHMVRAWQRDVRQLADRRVAKPRELRERQEALPVPDQ